MKRRLSIWIALSLYAPALLWGKDAPSPKDAEITAPAPYCMGQTPPGPDAAAVFAPGFISNGKDFVGNAAFLPDQTEFYYSVTDSKWMSFDLMRTQLREGKWTLPAKASLLENAQTLEPFFSPDGKRMYFNGGTIKDLNIWYIEKTGDAWGKPVRLPEPVNSARLEWYPTVSRKNTLFVGRDGEILVTVPQNGAYTGTAKLNLPGATAKLQYGDPYISPDEDFLIFIADGPAAFGQADLYISYKKENGGWTNPKNLGPEINTAEHEFGPAFTPDGKYFMFSRRKEWRTEVPSNIYWIKADFVARLKHTNYVPYANIPVGSKRSLLGQPFSLSIPDTAFIDDDGNQTLGYSATLENGDALPPWLKLDPATRSFSGKPDVLGTIQVRLSATDPAGASASTVFAIQVVVLPIEKTGT